MTALNERVDVVAGCVSKETTPEDKEVHVINILQNMQRRGMAHSSSQNNQIVDFYPTACKNCAVIVFTQALQMGSRAGGRKKFVRAVSLKQYRVGS